MNLMSRFKYAVLIVLIQVQRLSHSQLQYYPHPHPPYDRYNDYRYHHHPRAYPGHQLEGYIRSPAQPESEYFNQRELEPEYRQHQNYYSAYQEPIVHYYTINQVRKDVDSAGERRQFFEDTTPDPIVHAPVRSPCPGKLNPPEPTPPTKRSPDSLRLDMDMEGMVVSVGDREGTTSNSFRISNKRPANYAPGRPLDDEMPRRCPDPPDGYQQRIHRGDGKCYDILRRNQASCPALMTFYPEKDNLIYGDCDCEIDNGVVSRPVVYWRPHDRCYLLFHRGPCRQNEWLLLDECGLPRCEYRHRNCSSDDDETSTQFTFLYKGKCYETGRHYPDLCKGKGRDWKVYYPALKNAPECMEHPPKPGDSKGLGLWGPGTELRCRPGYKKMQNGECKRKATYDYDY